MLGGKRRRKKISPQVYAQAYTLIIKDTAGGGSGVWREGGGLENRGWMGEEGMGVLENGGMGEVLENGEM